MEDSTTTKRRLVVAVVVGVSLVACSPKGRRTVRRGASVLSSVFGFVQNTVWDLAHGRPKQQKWKEALRSLDNFIVKSGVGDEITTVMSHRFFTNLKLVEALQKKLPDLEKEIRSDPTNKYKIPSAQEAARYMRFATAVYGPSMISSVEMAVDADYVPYLSTTSQEYVLRHTSLRAEDILISDMDYGTGMDSLRHILAIDHSNKALVLSVRGTFDLSGVVVDLVGYTEPFCGGEAHAGMAVMAKEVWKKAQESIVQQLQKLPKDYNLIITGHSLGAGVASLMTIMAFHDKLVPPHVEVRCLAYAPPPVFFPLDAAQEAVKHTVAYVNRHDWVPSLSVSAIRRTFAQVAVLEEGLQHESYWQILRMRWGWSNIPEPIVARVEAVRHQPLREVKGAPALVIPANAVIHLKENDDSTEDDLSITPVPCDPIKQAQVGIYLHPNMMTDHFPSNYQLALESVVKHQEEDQGGDKNPGEKDRLL